MTGLAGTTLAVADVSVSFGSVQALGGVSLSVSDAQIVGLIGPNGAGKTTLFNVVSGFVRPRSGAVEFRGQAVTRWSATRRARAGMSRTFQNLGLDKPATVDENLCVAQEVCDLGRELREWILPPRLDVRQRHQGERKEIIELFGLGDVRKTPVNHLSLGLAKQVELACVMLRHPVLLLLDEPSSGLSVEETVQLGRVLRDLHRERGLAMLIIEHDMSLAMTLCEHLYVLDFGLLLAEGSPDSVRANPKVLEAYLGQGVA